MNPKSNDKSRSKCCLAPMRVASGSEGTSCYVCTKCGKPKDAVGDGPTIKGATFSDSSKGNSMRKEFEMAQSTPSAESDTAIVEWLAKHWNSQGRGQHVMNIWIPNVAGSFRSALLAVMKGEQGEQGEWK